MINKSKEEQEEDTKNDNDNNNNSNNKKIEQATLVRTAHILREVFAKVLAVALVTLDLLQGCGLRNFVPQLALQV